MSIDIKLNLSPEPSNLGISPVGKRLDPNLSGPPGKDGIDGNSILYGSGVPTPGIGINGNFYIDTDTYDLYGPKSGEIWTSYISLVGPPGSGSSIIDGTYGDIVVSGTGTVFSVNTNTISNTKLADMPANTLKGNNTGSSADPIDLTATQVRTLLNVANGATANDTDANLKNRANHTGTQLSSTISDFQTTVSSNTDVAANTAARHTHSNISILNATTASFTTALDTKLGIASSIELGYLSGVSSSIQTQINTINSSLGGLTDAVILKGSWAANAGTFPGSGTAKAGWTYIISVAGTVDGQTFAVGDRIMAIVANASTSTFASNWFKLDYTDQVLSVNTYTGAVVLNADDISDTSTTHKFATSAEKTKLGFITVTQAVDLDTIESDTATNNAKVSNATHTGEITGSTSLTLDKTAITNRSSVSAASGDLVLISDVSDSNNLKYVTVSSIIALAPGGVSDGDKGDITISSTGTVYTIDNSAVSYAKIQNVSATDKILGRFTAGAGVIEEIACTAAGRALIDDADATAQRNTLSLGTSHSPTFTAVTVNDDAYAVGWNGSTNVPTKNAVYDKIELLNQVLTGSGMIWYAATAPSGYLLCDGTAVSRTTYAALFAVISTTWGAGDGSTTFNLPDLRQRFPLGKAASGTGNLLAATGGNIDHTHTGPSHTHTVPAHYHGMGSGADLNITSSGAHTHQSSSGADFAIFVGSGPVGSGAGSNVNGTNTTSSVSHTHASGNFAGRIGLVTGGVDGNAAMTTGSAGTGATGTGNPPFLVVNYIIKT